VKTFAEIDGDKTHTGILESADDKSFVVDVNGAERTIRYDMVSSSRTVFVWEKPGQKTKHA
jgi:ribosome maturation factor RimP